MVWRKGLIPLLAALLAVLPFLGAYAQETSAATSRVAVIKEMTGTVQVKKAGGSKQFKAFTRMSLNEGDVLTTGANSTAVLQFANGTSEDDKMSVSANTTLTFSKLSDRSGTRTKVSMFNGTAWVDVKSITTKNDEFTLETPTAIMGVRGTHLLVAVDPDTGATKLTVAAGVVSTQSTGKGSGTAQVKPGDNALITKDGKDKGEITIAPVDLQLLVNQSDKSIVEAIVAASGDIVKENNERLDTYFEDGSLPANETERKKANVENLLGAIVDNAVKSGLITQDRAAQLVAEAEAQTGVKVDLTKKQQQLSDEEKKKQDEQRKKEEAAKKQAADEQKKQEEERKKNEELQKKIEADRKAKEEANKKAEEEKKRKAEEEYKKQLDDAKKKQFEADKQKKDEEERKAQEAARKAAEEAAAWKASQSPSPSPSTSPPPPPPPVLSSNANLSGLTVSQGNLSFAANVTDYAINVLNVAQIKIKPTAADSKATITIGSSSVASGAEHTVTLSETGPTTVQIKVKAEDGTVKTYSLTINRSTLLSGVTLPGSLGIQFDPEVKEYFPPPVSSETTTLPLSFGTQADQLNVSYYVNDTLVKSESAGVVVNVPLTEGNNEIRAEMTPVIVSAASGLIAANDLRFLAAAAGPTPTVYTLQVWRTPTGGDTGNASDLLGIDVLTAGTTRVAAQASLGAIHQWSAIIAPAGNSVNVKVYPKVGSDVITWNGTDYKYGQSVPVTLGAGVSTAVEFTVKSAGSGTEKGVYTLTINRQPLGVADLSNLVVSVGALSPSFDPATTEYQLTVPYGIVNVTVTPTAAANATFTVTGNTGLVVGENTVQVEVTAENGTTKKTYTITVTRQPNGLSGLTVQAPGALNPSFSNAITSYTMSVANSVTSLTVNPTVSDPDATITVNGDTVASGNASSSIPLIVGANEIKIVVQAFNGSQVKYTITVTREGSGSGASDNANLSGLTVEEGPFTPAFSANVINYEMDVAYEVTSVTVHATAAEGASATVAVKGNTNLAVGLNNVFIDVTAPSGATKQYKIVVYRLPSSDASIETITVSGADEVVRTGSAYEAVVPHDVSAVQLQVTAAKASEGASVAVTRHDGTVAVDLAQSQSLSYGENDFSIAVTAPNGTTATYALTIVRESPPGNTDATLKSMHTSQSNADLIGADHELTGPLEGVPFFAETLVVTPETNDPDATIVVWDRYGFPVTAANGSYAVPLTGELEQTVKVIVTAANGVASKTYKLIVRKQYEDSSLLVTAKAPMTGHDGQVNVVPMYRSLHAGHREDALSAQYNTDVEFALTHLPSTSVDVELDGIPLALAEGVEIQSDSFKVAFGSSARHLVFKVSGDEDGWTYNLELLGPSMPDGLVGVKIQGNDYESAEEQFMMPTKLDEDGIAQYVVYSQSYYGYGYYQFDLQLPHLSSLKTALITLDDEEPITKTLSADGSNLIEVGEYMSSGYHKVRFDLYEDGSSEPDSRFIVWILNGYGYDNPYMEPFSLTTVDGEPLDLSFSDEGTARTYAPITEDHLTLSGDGMVVRVLRVGDASLETAVRDGDNFTLPVGYGTNQYVIELEDPAGYKGFYRMKIDRVAALGMADMDVSIGGAAQPLRWVHMNTADMPDEFAIGYAAQVGADETSVKLAFDLAEGAENLNVRQYYNDDSAAQDLTPDLSGSTIDLPLDTNSVYSYYIVEYDLGGTAVYLNLMVLRGEPSPDATALGSVEVAYSEGVNLPVFQANDHHFVAYMYDEADGYDRIAVNPYPVNYESRAVTYDSMGRMVEDGYLGNYELAEGWNDFHIVVSDASGFVKDTYYLSVWMGSEETAVDPHFGDATFETDPVNPKIGTAYYNPSIVYFEMNDQDDLAKFRLGSAPAGTVLAGVYVDNEGVLNPVTPDGAGYYAIDLNMGAGYAQAVLKDADRYFVYELLFEPEESPELSSLTIRDYSYYPFNEIGTVNFDAQGKGYYTIPGGVSTIGVEPNRDYDMKATHVQVDGQTIDNDRSSVKYETAGAPYTVSITVASPSGKTVKTYTLYIETMRALSNINLDDAMTAKTGPGEYLATINGEVDEVSGSLTGLAGTTYAITTVTGGAAASYDYGELTITGLDYGLNVFDIAATDPSLQVTHTKLSIWRGNDISIAAEFETSIGSTRTVSLGTGMDRLLVHPEDLSIWFHPGENLEDYGDAPLMLYIDDEDHGFTYKLNGNPFTHVEGSMYKFSLPLSELETGDNKFLLSVFDGSGNEMVYDLHYYVGNPDDEVLIETSPIQVNGYEVATLQRSVPDYIADLVPGTTDFTLQLYLYPDADAVLYDEKGNRFEGDTHTFSIPGWEASDGWVHSYWVVITRNEQSYLHRITFTYREPYVPEDDPEIAYLTLTHDEDGSPLFADFAFDQAFTSAQIDMGEDDQPLRLTVKPEDPSDELEVLFNGQTLNYSAMDGDGAYVYSLPGGTTVDQLSVSVGTLPIRKTYTYLFTHNLATVDTFHFSPGKSFSEFSAIEDIAPELGDSDFAFTVPYLDNFLNLQILPNEAPTDHVFSVVSVMVGDGTVPSGGDGTYELPLGVGTNVVKITTSATNTATGASAIQTYTITITRENGIYGNVPTHATSFVLKNGYDGSPLPSVQYSWGNRFYVQMSTLYYEDVLWDGIMLEWAMEEPARYSIEFDPDASYGNGTWYGLHSGMNVLPFSVVDSETEESVHYELYVIIGEQSTITYDDDGEIKEQIGIHFNNTVYFQVPASVDNVHLHYVEGDETEGISPVMNNYGNGQESVYVLGFDAAGRIVSGTAKILFGTPEAVLPTDPWISDDDMATIDRNWSTPYNTVGYQFAVSEGTNNFNVGFTLATGAMVDWYDEYGAIISSDTITEGQNAKQWTLSMNGQTSRKFTLLVLNNGYLTAYRIVVTYPSA